MFLKIRCLNRPYNCTLYNKYNKNINKKININKS